MTDDTRHDDRRLSKYSNADRLAFTKSNRPEPDESALLSQRLEAAIRDEKRWGQDLRDSEPEPEDREQPEPPEILPERLILELHHAQDQLWTEAPSFTDEPVHEPAHDGMEIEPPHKPATFLALLPESQSRVRRIREAVVSGAGQAQRTSVSVWRTVQPIARSAAQDARRAATATARFVIRNGPALHPRNLQRRYYRFLWTVHTDISDRAVERLLFKKTKKDKDSSLPEAARAIPRLGLDWAWSGLPSDLKRFAFVDFRAGNGRNLLLASRLNFEFAAGIVYDDASYGDIELNVAQYPRSRMACRDIRILRGDADGIAIPQQPVVLFFASSLPESHLDIVMSHVSASFRLNPRPMFLIFENAAPNYAVPYSDIFAPARIPPAARIKMALLNPARTLIYQSRSTSEE